MNVLFLRDTFAPKETKLGVTANKVIQSIILIYSVKTLLTEKMPFVFFGRNIPLIQVQII